jgi:hypothetical protein
LRKGLEKNRTILPREKMRSPIKQGFGVGMESGLGIIAGRINRGWLAIKLLISWLSGSRPPTTIDR